MTSTRQLKFSRLIQKELAEIFQKDQKSFFAGNIISVTQVDVSPDFSIADIYLSLVLDRDKEKMLEIVQNHKGNIKRSLSKNIGKQVRRIPDLRFHLDLGAEHAQKMDEIFRKLHTPSTEDDQ
ncbi:MAG: 30S ribosome-binding factor RbfA [Cyclobacteriaceae bacterium]|nr:30S ribosome-binding factor RbfA [Cyclobacteriaceae bacterium]